MLMKAVLLVMIALGACVAKPGLPELTPAPAFVGQIEAAGAPTQNELSGVAIATAPGRPEYAISLQARGADTVLLLERLTARTRQGVPNFVVDAAVRQPRLANGEALSLGTCRRDGQVDDTIIAVVAATDSEVYRRVKAAWRADTAGRRFVPLSTRGIDCVNEGYGE